MSKTKTPILHWEGDDTVQWLYAGNSRVELAWLEKRTKFWSAAIWLPELSPTKQYAPLEEQKKDVEALVRQWFEKAMEKHVQS